MECSRMQRRMTRVRSARSALHVSVDDLQQRTHSTGAFFCGSPERAIVGRLCTERPLRPRSLRAGSGRIPDARFERGNHVDSREVSRLHSQGEAGAKAPMVGPVPNTTWSVHTFDDQVRPVERPAPLPLESSFPNLALPERESLQQHYCSNGYGKLHVRDAPFSLLTPSHLGTARAVAGPRRPPRWPRWWPMWRSHRCCRGCSLFQKASLISGHGTDLLDLPM